MAIVLSTAIAGDAKLEITIGQGHYLAMRARGDNVTKPSRHFGYRNANAVLFYTNNLD